MIIKDGNIMDLTNKQVLHKSFGKGKIVDFNDSYMLINFKSGNRKFVYPDAFDGYLKLVEKEAANSVDKILQIQEKERKIEEEKIEKEKVEEFEEQQRLERIDKLIKSHKMHSSSQVAFNCDKDELNDIFTDWKTFTGTIKSGDNKGKTNKLIRVHQNSACLITSKDSGAKEKDRCILGLYMVDEKFMGRLCEDGYIPSHSDYKIKLTEEESKKMLFWKYYADEKYQNNITWNSGRYRYFDNMWMAQILKDLVELRSEQKEHDVSQELFDYFCFVNNIEEKSISEPNGPLMRLSSAII